MNCCLLIITYFFFLTFTLTTIIEAQLTSAPSFFSSISFNPADVDSWPTQFTSCKSVPERIFTYPLIPAPTKQFPIVDNTSVFLNKVPSPIRLIPPSTSSSSSPCNFDASTGSWNLIAGCTPNVTLDVTKEDESKLYFNPKASVAQAFKLSYYMSKTTLPSQSSSSGIMDLGLDVEFSFVRALTLSIPSSSSNLGTEFTTNTKSPTIKNAVLYQFKQAVFLGAPASVPNFASHVLNGATFPMEIYLYFASPKCVSPECTLQLVVLVQEGPDDNAQIEPIIKTAEALYNQELAFMQENEVLKLDAFANLIYNRNDPNLVRHWNAIHTNLEFIHLIHHYRSIVPSLFNKIESVPEQMKAAKDELLESQPYFDFTDSTNQVVQYLQSHGFETSAFVARFDTIRSTVVKLLEKMKDVLNVAAVSTSENLVSNLAPLREEMLQFLQLIIDEFDSISKFGDLMSVPFKATRHLRDGNGDIDESQLTNANIHESKSTTFQQYFTAIKSYIFVHLDEVGPILAQVAAFDRSVHLVNIDLPTTQNNHGLLFLRAWKNALSALPKYIADENKAFLDQLVQKSSSLRGTDLNDWLALQTKARNNVPQVVVADKFQISWLMPHGGGHYTYTGSTPFPPCHTMSQTIVFETPIRLSSSQIQRLSRVPTSSSDPSKDLTSTRPYNHADPSKPNTFDPLRWFPEGNPKILFKYNGASPGWFGGSDGHHELTIKPEPSSGSLISFKNFNGLLLLLLGIVLVIFI